MRQASRIRNRDEGGKLGGGKKRLRHKAIKTGWGKEGSPKIRKGRVFDLSASARRRGGGGQEQPHVPEKRERRRE